MHFVHVVQINLNYLCFPAKSALLKQISGEVRLIVCSRDRDQYLDHEKNNFRFNRQAPFLRTFPQIWPTVRRSMVVLALACRLKGSVVQIPPWR